METLKIKKFRENALIPARQTSGSAGYDLHAAVSEEVTIAAGESQMIPTGIGIAIDGADTAAFIYARSSMGAKFGVVPANCVGVIDSDYRGEIFIPMRNHGSDVFVVTDGMRIAQMVISQVETPDLEEVQEFEETERGAGGFGSTGE